VRPAVWPARLSAERLDHTDGRAELFAWLAKDVIDVHIGATYPLAEAAAAHRALESRATVGKLMLRP
jgi:NADPH:quinone reductase-like Zn-dependent oxidoreductase